MPSTRTPMVSVVIPVYRDPEGLRRCLDALARQTYPQDRFEVIVVDNAPQAEVRDVAAGGPAVHIVHAPRPGSYAARNVGITVARGDLLAFTDADCRPRPDWIERGVKMLRSKEGIGLVAGAIVVVPRRRDRPNLAERYDAYLSFPQRHFAQEKHFGATANMFTRRTVIQHVGPFRADLYSGGDYEFGTRVHEAGYDVVFGEDAVIEHPARPTVRAILRKARRVTAGVRTLRAKTTATLPHQRPAWQRYLRLFRFVVPPVAECRRRLVGRAVSRWTFVGLVWVEYLVKWAIQWEHLRLRVLRRHALRS